MGTNEVYLDLDLEHNINLNNEGVRTIGGETVPKVLILTILCFVSD